MALKGNLTDLNIADLIQLNCQSSARARLTARRGEDEIVQIYFADGEIAHALRGDRRGEEVIYDILGWEEGTFEMEQEIEPPERSIEMPWSALIIEGLRRIDEMREAQSLSQSTTQKEQGEMNAETRRDRLAKALRTLIDNSGDINGVAVVSMDGLIMAADLPSNVEQARVGAVAAAILSLSGRSVSQLKRGELQQTLVQGSDGNIVITHTGPNAVLVALTGAGVNLGMVFLDVRECALTVAEILG